MKLKIIASPNSLSAIFSKKLFYQTFLKMNLVLMMMKLLYETKAKKKFFTSEAEQSCTKPALNRKTKKHTSKPHASDANVSFKLSSNQSRPIFKINRAF